MKQCSKCGEEKELTAFAKRTGRTRSVGCGYRAACRLCENASKRALRKNKPDAFRREWEKKYASIMKDPLRAERYRESDAIKKRRRYHRDPKYAAKKSALSTLRKAGLQPSLLPDELINAKMYHLLVVRFIKKHT